MQQAKKGRHGPNKSGTRIEWRPIEWADAFAKFNALEVDPNAPKEIGQKVRLVNATMARPRPMEASNAVSSIWALYQEFKAKGRVVTRTGTVTKADVANAMPTVTNNAPASAANDPHAPGAVTIVRPSAANPFPNAPRPDLNGAQQYKPRIDPLADIEIDGLPPPTFQEELTEMAVEVMAEVVAGILNHENVRSALRGLIETALGREQEVAQDTTSTWAGTELIRGPKILLVGLKGEQAKMIIQEIGPRANLRYWESSSSKQALKNMLGAVDLVIGVTKFMSHSAEQAIVQRVREKYIRHGGGMSGVRDKIEVFLENWTRKQLAESPRAGSMSAGPALAAVNH